MARNYNGLLLLYRVLWVHNKFLHVWRWNSRLGTQCPTPAALGFARSAQPTITFSATPTPCERIGEESESDKDRHLRHDSSTADIHVLTSQESGFFECERQHSASNVLGGSEAP